MPGPIANVGTIVAALNFDLNRQLNWGRGLTLEFLVPDVSVPGGLRLVQTVRKGFDRLSGDEVTRGDGHTIILSVALVKQNVELVDTLREKDLQVRVDGELYSVGQVPPVAPNEPQVFTLTCKARTTRNKYFDNTKGR